MFPAFSICLLDGILWDDSDKVHHTFRLTDRDSGRTLGETLEIHTIELGRYNLREQDLATASMFECWLYWLLHAHEYEAEELLKLFPQEPTGPRHPIFLFGFAGTNASHDRLARTAMVASELAS